VRGSRRARLLGLLAAALVLAIATAGPAPAQTEPADTTEPATEGEAPAEGETPAEVDPFDQLASCVGAEGRLLVVLLVDESASLRETDPDDQRVAAARAALRSIDLLRGTDASGEDVAIDVLVSTFSFSFSAVGEWTRLSGDTRSAIDERIAGLADRDESMDTDFHNALDGARRALADRATETDAEADGNACKAILLFTDGAFTLGPRTTAEQRERFGTTKSYAPGVVLDSEEAVREATGLGVTALCRAGGIADQVRTDGITVVSVPLGEGSGLLEALTTGSSDERDCGDPATAAARPGAYLPAPDTDELLRVFDLVASRIGGGQPAGDPSTVLPCDDDPCDEGAVDFAVSPELRRVHIFATVPGDGSRIVLEPPEGEPAELAPGDDLDEEVGGVPVTARWIADRALTIDLEVPDDGTGAGDWRVVLVGREGEATGVVQIVTFSDLIARFNQFGSSFEIGAEGAIAAYITASDEEEPTDEALTDVTITATVTDPITGRATSVSLAEGDGGWFAPYTMAEDMTSAALLISLRLEATTDEGATLTSIAPEVEVIVRRPAGYPQIGTTGVELSSVEGEGVANGTVLLVAGEEEGGCAWLEDLTVTGAPEAAEPLTLTVDGVGRDEDGCTTVDEPIQVGIEIEPGARASGTVVGHVRLQLARAGGEDPIPTDIPITFEMARGVDQAKRLALAAGLMLGGLLLPLLLLVVINRLTTRFQDLGHVRGARIPVVVTRTGQILRSDGGRTALRLGPDDFTPLEGLGGKGRFTWGGLVFRARTPLNPFAEPYATVAAADGTADVSREGRRTDLALGLAGSWLFLLDQDATRAAPGPDIHGVLVGFTSAGGQGEADRLVADVQARGPATAQRLARVAGIETATTA
jgi:hypothetical protein